MWNWPDCGMRSTMESQLILGAGGMAIVPCSWSSSLSSLVEEGSG